MRAIAGSILILAAVQFHTSAAANRPLGFCLLSIIALAGVGFLVFDLAGAERSRYVHAFLGRWFGWMLRGGNFLIKGTLIGALAGLLVNVLYLGGSRVGNLAAMPGAFLGLMLGVVLDAVMHRYQHRRPIEPTAASDPLANDPLADDAPLANERRPLVESHGWDLSPGISHTMPDWPVASKPFDRR